MLPSRIPSSKGCEYSSVWESAAGGGRWPIYGGTNEGFLFRLDARAGRAVNLGKPAVARGLRCLAVSKSGIVYGMTGEPEGLARLFRYSPADGFTDLGRPVLSQKALWRGHRFSAAACGPAGAIIFGEDDTQSHLWVYDAR